MQDPFWKFASEQLSKMERPVDPNRLPDLCVRWAYDFLGSEHTAGTWTEFVFRKAEYNLHIHKYEVRIEDQSA